MTTDQTDAQVRSELAALDRVSHRLAMTDADQLSSVLQKLLPRLVLRLLIEHQQSKVMGILSHVLKRVREDVSCQLPCDSLLETVQQQHESVLVRQVCVAFLQLGVPRTKEIESILPLLLKVWSSLQEQYLIGTESLRTQANALALLVLGCVERAVDNPVNVTEIRTLLQQNVIAANLYDLFLDALLYNQQQAPQTPTTSTIPPEGLSQAGVQRLMASNNGTASSIRRLCKSIIHLIHPQQMAIFMEEPIVGQARTLALLVVACNDERAKQILQQYMDTVQISNAIIVASALMQLCLAQTQAETIVSNNNTDPSSLGATLPVSPSTSTQLILSTKRRPVSEATLAVLVAFVTKLVTDCRLPSRTVLPDLAMAVSRKTLQTYQATSLSMPRAKPYIAVLELVSILVTKTDIPNVSELVQPLLVLPNTATPPNNNSDGNVAVRDVCYGILSTLARLQPNSLLENHASTAKLLFGSVSKEDERLRPRAMAALDALLGAYQRVYIQRKQHAIVVEDSSNNPWQSATTSPMEQSIPLTPDAGALTPVLLPLLWNAAQPNQSKVSRVAAARWSCDLLKELDLLSACHILCFLSGDADPTAASIARQEGLGLEPNVSDNLVMESSTVETLPDFSDYVATLFSSQGLYRYSVFSFQGKATSLRFGLKCLFSDLYGGPDDAVQQYCQALCETLRQFLIGPSLGHAALNLLDECAFCLCMVLSTSQLARSLLWSQKLAVSLRELETMALDGTSSRARRNSAAGCGKLYEDTSLDGNSFQDLIAAPLGSACAIMSGITTSRLGTTQFHGAAFLGAHVVKAVRLRLAGASIDADSNRIFEQSASILVAFGRGTIHSDEIIGNAGCDSLVVALSYDGQDAPILDGRLYNATASILIDLKAAMTKFGGTDHADALRSMKLVTAAGVCLAATTTASGISEVSTTENTEGGVGLSIGQARLVCAEALFDLLGSAVNRKQEDLALVIGEALGAYADAYSPIVSVWESSEEEWTPGYDPSFARHLPPHGHVLYTLLRRIAQAASPPTRTAAAPALLALVARTAKAVNLDPGCVNRFMVQELVKRLDSIQQTFLVVLADPKSKQFARESCCLGLAACRSISNVAGSASVGDDLNRRLLRAFGQTTNFGGSAYMESHAQAAERRAAERSETSQNPTFSMEPFGDEGEVGGVSGMGEAALGAYREMAAASVALGRHDILYALLILSVSHPCWFDDERKHLYSAASLLGMYSSLESRTGAVELREALRPHLGKLIPRMLRARHDPNRQTREQMSSLWVGLTGGGAESRLAISQHLLTTLDALIDDAASKLWRARVGACGAIAELIVGRDWESLGGGGAVLTDDEETGSNVTAGIRLLRLWRVATRSMDDVRGAVRESGETLGRAVRALTIRLCDPSASENSNGGVKRGRDEDSTKYEREAGAAAATCLRWILKRGLNHPCIEATGICVSTLVEVVGVVRPKILEPILPDLLRSLLMAMSGLEPAALNFLQLRTDDQEGLERIRLQLIQQGPLATAVSKCLDLLPGANIETQHRVVFELDAALRLSAGFATRAAVADTVSTLCSTCPNAFRFSGSSTSNPSARLLRAFYFASERERGQGAKDRMIHALGSLASLCPGPSVRSLAVRACERYKASTGNSDDPVSRRAAAAVVRSIVVRASVHLADGGNLDVWRNRILPVAFLGKKDDDPKVASLWSEVWDEGGSTTETENSSCNGPIFGTRLEEKLLFHLVGECVRALRDVSWGRRRAGASALVDLTLLGILSPVARPTGATAVNPQDVDRARFRCDVASAAIRECVSVLTKPRLWTGKSDVLNAAVALVCPWVAAVQANASFGCHDVPSTCPWQPIVVSITNEMDLFLGDGWFRGQATTIGSEMNMEDLEEAADGVGAVVVGLEDNDGTKIDFDECETALVNETKQMDIAMEATAVEAFSPLTFCGLIELLLRHALKKSQAVSDESLPFRVASFQGIKKLLQSLPSDEQKIRRQILLLSSDRLLGFVDHAKDPPVLIAGALACLGSCFWKDMNLEDTATNPVDLSKLLLDLSGNNQPAWTVRESSILCMSELARCSNSDSLRQRGVISAMMDCASHGLQDRKYWRVRLAGIKVLHSLVCRTVATANRIDSEQPRQLILEAILPHKEVMLRLLRKSIQDPEPSVTALSTEVLGNMSWWP